MASQLNQLKSQINTIAHDLKQTGSEISQYQQRLERQVQQIQATIGGSAQKKDQQVIAVLQRANAQVKATVEAMHEAAQVSTNYSSSL